MKRNTYEKPSTEKIVIQTESTVLASSGTPADIIGSVDATVHEFDDQGSDDVDFGEVSFL